MNCKQCNLEIGNQRFCPNCGTDNTVQAVPQYQPQAQYEAPVQNQNFNVQTEAPSYSAPVEPTPVAPVTPVVSEVPTQPEVTAQAYTPDYSQYMPQNNAPAQTNYNAPAQGDFGAPVQNQYSTPYGAQPNGYQQYLPQNNQAQQGYAPTNVPAIEDPGKSKATAALIWGIVSLFFGLIPGIIAIIMAKKYNEVGNGASASTAKGGKIMGIIGIVLGVLIGLLILLLGGSIIAIFMAAMESAAAVPMIL